MEVSTFNSAAFFGQKAATPKAGLDANAFIKLLTVQLANQNPLEPMKDSDFFAQLAQLGTVNGIDKMKGSLDMSQAAGMLGKTVSGSVPGSTAGSASNFSGVVERVTLKDGAQTLTVRQFDGTRAEVKLTAVQSIE